MLTTIVPITIDADAQEHINKLGVQNELDLMLEHAVGTMLDLQRIHIVYPPAYEHEDDMVVIEAWGPWSATQLGQIGDEYYRWVFQTIPPEVFGYLLLTACPSPIDESSQTA